MTTSADIVVVGGGIVGAACAHACNQAGLDVVLIERDVVGGGTTAAGMGHLVALDDSEAQFALCRYSQTLWDELAPRLVQRSEFERTGTLWVAADDEELAEAHRKRDFYRSHEVTADVLDAHELARLEPNLRPGLRGALQVPGDAVVYPPVVAQWLVDTANPSRLNVLLGRTVTALRPGMVQLDDGTRVHAPRIVHAAGDAAPRLCPQLPIRPRKGHLAITARYPGFVRHQLVELGYLKSAHGEGNQSVAFNVQPRATGQLLIGSSRQFGVVDSRVEMSMLTAMLARALTYLPKLAELQIVRTWTGMRAATRDNLPLIGPDPELPGLFHAVGHEGLGITQSLGTAALLVDLLLEREPAIDPRPYSPLRFRQQEAVARVG